MVDSIKHNMRQMLVPGAQDAKAAPPRGGQAPQTLQRSRRVLSMPVACL